jgi:hypothetical protein
MQENPQQPKQEHWQPPNQFTQYPPQEQWQQPPQQGGSPQQHWQQQPYPPQYQPPMPPPPPKKSHKRVWLGIAIVFGLLVLWGGISQALYGPSSPGTDTSNQATQAVAPTTQAEQPTEAPTAIPPTPTPMPIPKWTTTHTFNGNGVKKTAIFPVPDDWKLIWTCDPASFGGISYNLIVTVYAQDNSIVDLAVNTLCGSSNRHGETEEHQGGQVWLDVSSEAAWTLQVQELK